MFWADKITSEFKKKTFQHIQDMKTPSGRIHVGALRGVIIHDLVYKALIDTGLKAEYSYVFDDNDPMDSLPVYLPKEKFERYMGFPLNKVPSPGAGGQNFAEFYALEFKEVFNQLGANPEIIWASELYNSGKMDEGIKICLDNAEKIRKIYKRVSGADLPSDWFPFSVVCEKCGKVGTTRVYAWDGKEVSYRCLPNLVEWAGGCGFEGKISPFGGTGKLPWKVYWAVKWQALGVTIEGAGKDHMSKGGSHDIASAVCEEILSYETPCPVPYEFFLIGGRKMSSSKGLGSSAKEVAEILPPELLRFLMVRVPTMRTIDFAPGGMTIPDLFDEYDRCAREWFEKGRKSDLGRIFELSQISRAPKREIVFPRFRDVATFIQMPGVDIKKQFLGVSPEILEERMKYAKIWLDGYAPADFVFKVQEKLPSQVKELSPEQKKYLREVAEIIQKDWKNETKLGFELYEAAKKVGLPSVKAFEAIYLVLLGRPHGPKAAALLLSQDKKFLGQRIKEATR